MSLQMRMKLNVCTHLLRNLPHLLLQIVILLSQSSVLLEKRLADLCSQLQISLFLVVEEKRREKQRSKDDTLLLYATQEISSLYVTHPFKHGTLGADRHIGQICSAAPHCDLV